MAKYLLLVLLCNCFAANLLSQDTIMLRSGDTILCKVHEVGVTEVKYYMPDNLNGPLYAVAKDDVFVIKYKSGYKDVFSNSELHEAETTNKPAKKLKPQPTYLRLLQKSQRRITAGATLTGAGGGLLIAGITILAVTPQRSATQNNEISTFGALLVLGGAASVIAGPIILSSGLKNRRKAQKAVILSFNPITDTNFNRYNQAINQNKVGTISFTF